MSLSLLLITAPAYARLYARPQGIIEGVKWSFLSVSPLWRTSLSVSRAGVRAIFEAHAPVIRHQPDRL